MHVNVDEFSQKKTNNEAKVRLISRRPFFLNFTTFLVYYWSCELIMSSHVTIVLFPTIDYL